MLYLANNAGVWVSGLSEEELRRAFQRAVQEKSVRRKRKPRKRGDITAWDGDIEEECEFQRRVKGKRPVIDIP